jgi:CheY-like chemotaxis protein
VFSRRPSRVLIVDDDPVFAELIRCILNAEPQFEIVARARDGREGVELAERLVPDLVVMDLRMPLMDGFEATRRIAHVIDARILVVSSSHDPEDAARAFDAGAAAYIPKDRAATDLARLLERFSARSNPNRGWRRPSSGDSNGSAVRQSRTVALLRPSALILVACVLAAVFAIHTAELNAAAAARAERIAGCVPIAPRSDDAVAKLARHREMVEELGGVCPAAAA